MKHHKKSRKLGRVKKTRVALLKSLAFSLVKYEKITTTEAKAREIRPAIEKLVTKAKKGDLASRRDVSVFIGPMATKKLFDKMVPELADRKGGYTRIVKLPLRLSDGAKMALIEFVKKD